MFTQTVTFDLDKVTVGRAVEITSRSMICIRNSYKFHALVTKATLDLIEVQYVDSDGDMNNLYIKIDSVCTDEEAIATSKEYKLKLL